ncbi:MAG: type pantothenate kinase [Bacteroidota bacterium]|jgi:type III pantothenate kinase|nr:type pantothenate kinase [Bacteroidota bacterium]
MQLVIDIGNTRVKAAVFEGKALKDFFVYPAIEDLLKADLIKQYDIKNCIIGSVVNEIELLVKELRTRTQVLLFDHNTPLPIKNLYHSAATLGSDRLAAAIGANALAKGENILVIDAGTCIKYNFVNADNEYIGGGISPGLQMRFKAMNTFTSRLPLIEKDPGFDELVGTDTAGSMLSGVQIGAVAEVEGVIAQYTQRFNNLKVFLTGGDSDFFAKRLKKPIFADQFLILKGLNEILEHNK